MTWISSAGKTSKGNKSRRGPQSGFTLIEMIAVLALIGLILILATPLALSTLDRIKNDSSARKMVASLASVRSQAVAIKSVFEFQGDLDKHRYWVHDPETEENFDSVQLGPGIRFREFQYGDEAYSEGIFSIAFFPLGNTSGGTIILETTDTEDESSVFLLTVDPVTGKPYLQHAS